MYRAFQLQECEFSLENWVTGFVANHLNIEPKVQKAFDAFLETGEINATLLRDEWFPEIESDVFISHSHADEKTALGLSGWLKHEFGLSAFVDSSVWGHSTELLKQLDEKYNKTGPNTYDYKESNVAASHVHMMVATALMRMLDNAECAIFIGSPQSIKTSNNGDAKLFSPWIHYEVSQMEVLRRKTPVRRTQKSAAAQHDFSAIEESMKFTYDFDFKNFSKLNADALNKWVDRSKKAVTDRHPLDVLYELAPPPVESG